MERSDREWFENRPILKTIGRFHLAASLPDSVS
jgi:hypothetical protein